MLNRHYELCGNRRIASIPTTTRLHENSTPAAWANLDGRRHAFIEEEFQAPVVEILRVATPSARNSLRAGTAAAGRLNLLVLHRQELFVREPVAWSFEECGNIAHRSDHDEFPAKLPAKLVEILIIIDDCRDYVGCYWTIRSRCPRFWICDHLKTGRRDDPRRKVVVRPTAAKRAPGLQVDVYEFPFHQLLSCPFRGRLDLGRAGQSSAVNVCQVAQDVHDL